MDQFAFQLTISQLRNIVRQELQACLESKNLQKADGGSTQEEVLNIRQVAELLKMKTSSIYKLVNKRKIPFYKRGKRLYFISTELMDWLKGKGI